MRLRKYISYMAGALVFMITILPIVFLMNIEIPLPLSHEQKAELAAYAPDQGTSVFKGLHWKMDIGEYQIEVAEFVFVSVGEQLEIRYFIVPRVTKKVEPAPHFPLRNPLTLV